MSDTLAITMLQNRVTAVMIDPDVPPKRHCLQSTQLVRYTVSQHKEMCVEMDKDRKENTKVNLFC